MNMHMNQKGFANILLAVVVAILVGIIGYFAFMKKAGPVTQQPTPIPIPTATPTPTAASPVPTANDAPAGWKTFINSQDRYSFKYPADVLSDPEMSSDTVDSGSGWMWSAEIGYPDSLGAFASFFTFNGSIDDSIHAYYKENERIQVTNTQDAIINGRQAKIILWKDTAQPQTPAGKQYFIQYTDGKVLILSGPAKTLFDQVASTVRF